MIGTNGGGTVIRKNANYFPYDSMVGAGDSIYPSLYLKDNVNITGCSGTATDPYQISLN